MANDSISRRDVLAAAAAGAALVAGAGANAQPKASQADELTRLTIAEAGKRIAARTLSPVDLTRAYLERIERLNPRVNAYITVTADAALAQARALEAELASGKSRGRCTASRSASRTTSTRPGSARLPRARFTRSACRPPTRPSSRSCATRAQCSSASSTCTSSHTAARA